MYNKPTGDMITKVYAEHNTHALKRAKEHPGRRCTQVYWYAVGFIADSNFKYDITKETLKHSGNASGTTQLTQLVVNVQVGILKAKMISCGSPNKCFNDTKKTF